MKISFFVQRGTIDSFKRKKKKQSFSSMKDKTYSIRNKFLLSRMIKLQHSDYNIRSSKNITYKTVVKM